MRRSLNQTDGHGTVVLKYFQFCPSLVAVCFVGLFTGRSVGYNNDADRVVYNCDSILLFEERHFGPVLTSHFTCAKFNSGPGCSNVG